MTIALSKSTAAKTETYPLRPLFLVALAMAGLLVAVVLGWGTQAHLDSAINATGQVKVEAEIKTVQHADGGRVAEILVQAGDSVQAGQVLMRLNLEDTQVELDLRFAQLADQQARAARLRAERDGLDVPNFPADLAALHADAARAMASETQLLALSRADLEQKSQSLQLQLDQLKIEAKGLASRQIAARGRLAQAETVAARAEALATKGALPQAKLDEARTALLTAQSEVDDLQNAVLINAQKQKASAFDLTRLPVETGLAAQKQLQEVEARIAELTETIRLTELKIGRGEIRSPVAGTVNELPVNTVGQVLPAGATLATIVPTDRNLVVEFFVDPRDIDDLIPGQSLRLRFTAFDSRTAPEFKGTILRLAAAATVDQASGRSHYLATARLDPSQNAEAARALVPGMPAEVRVTLNARTALQYLLQPVSDNLDRAMSEK